MSAGEKTLRTEVFRRQHREIQDVVRLIEGQLVLAATVPYSEDVIRGHLNALVGKLTVHLAMEDNALYPRVRDHGSLRLRKLAAELVADMGGIQARFREYLARWSAPERIAESNAEFIRETTDVLEAVKRRIAREEAELYPLVDRED
jgi:hemerythrin-like domain-containing protein